MKVELLFILAIIATLAMLFSSSLSLSCRPSLFHIERREPRTEPILPWRKDKVPE